MKRLFVVLLVFLLQAPARITVGADAELRTQALQTLRKAVDYYRTEVASHGGYVYFYSADLQRRWGEGEFGPETIFTEPPGTPTVGMAYLQAYEATGEQMFLDAACEAAEALVNGQLKSGGWAQAIHFAPPRRGRMGDYRKRPGGNWNHSSLDDGQTQSALQMLMRADRALEFKHEAIREAVEYGLNALLKAQFANGGFPQGWRAPVKTQTVVNARYPDYDWKTERRVKNYWDCYTLNDNLAGTVAETLILAHEIYDEDRYLAALRKLGDFLILAQMPDPQPAWCQQYNDEMHPMWARKFEPPAITGGESQDAMRALIRIADHTGDGKYLKPIPRALAYFENKCLLPDGRIARFYELRTNKPLYMDKQYRLTYDDSAVPSHYSWKQRPRFNEIRAMYETVRRGKHIANKAPSKCSLEKDVRRIIDALDENGRWVSVHDGDSLAGGTKFERGYRYLSSAVFSRNVETLSAFLAERRALD